MKRLGRRARKRRALSHPRLAPLERATCPESVDGWAYWSTRGHVWLKDLGTGARYCGSPFVGGDGWTGSAVTHTEDS